MEEELAHDGGAPISLLGVDLAGRGYCSYTVCLVSLGSPSLATPNSTVTALCCHSHKRSVPWLGVYQRVCLLHTDLAFSAPWCPWGLALSLSQNPSLGIVFGSRPSGSSRESI